MQPVDAQDVVAKAQAPKQEQTLAATATPVATPDNKPTDFLVEVLPTLLRRKRRFSQPPEILGKTEMLPRE